MKKLLILPVLFALVQCNNPDNSVNQNTKDSLTLSDTAVAKNTQTYEECLNSLPLEESALLEGLRLFSTSYKKENGEENDQALKVYLDFQSKLIDVLNNKLSDRPELEKLNTLFTGDTIQRLPEAVVLEKELLGKGLSVCQSEGTIYFDRNTKIIEDYFLSSLSPAGKEFLTQFSIETNTPYSEDAGLSIPVKDLGDRVVFWDKFLVGYPGNLFSEEAKSRYDAYRLSLLIGMDNTPAFESEDQKLGKEYSDAYQYIIEKYPATRTSNMLLEYQKVLAANNNKYKDPVKKFIGKN